ncbi:membrane protein insertion efficiency factor YidD [Mariprofundus erugo]|uniref:Membrane protein insertion efficiency factor YidD n=1 Tax=Mariprofundus erugo TaxID=2528639 RepID=A0A5R9GMP3_9PROT|nr:membrane protein insertion efficiency factor YidD [Mariprofundus erugo]TLS67310.1 membrane protein insertion efficiency factor YidD [Mariprofundus erugo]TLS74959.1 membrane protein insertion efficiency factor YidD [Mariprofundus erugo]
MVGLIRWYLLLASLSLLLSAGLREFSLPAMEPARVMIGLYQYVLGPLDGRSCPAYPVCSAYAAESLHRYGLLTGSWLMLDRLIHEGDDLKHGPWVMVDGERRLFDPLERNAFWLAR